MTHFQNNNFKDLAKNSNFAIKKNKYNTHPLKLVNKMCNMKWIQLVLWKIQSQHDSVQGEIVCPHFNFFVFVMHWYSVLIPYFAVVLEDLQCFFVFFHFMQRYKLACCAHMPDAHIWDVVLIVNTLRHQCDSQTKLVFWGEYVDCNINYWSNCSSIICNKITLSQKPKLFKLCASNSFPNIY